MKTINADSTNRFSDRVADYVRYRPGYPEPLYQALALDPSAIVVDIGSGTGISSEFFLRHGHQMIGVEPNEAMRQAAESQFSHDARFKSVAGTAESTTLPDDCADLIVAAQAFHWFDRVKARAEFMRILRSGGRVAVIWNTRRTSSTPFLRDYESLLREFGTDYDRVRHDSLDRAAIAEFFRGPFQSFRFDNGQEFDWEGLQGRLRSSSYVPSPDHPRHQPMMEQFAKVFEQHAVSGRVMFQYDTELFIGALR
ncbi:MAG: class I SAM-dependent methyltransferase [Gemmataceae bacterium]